MYSDYALWMPGRGPGQLDLYLPPWQGFNSIPREAWDIESKWTMFHISIAKAAARSCSCKVVGACYSVNPWTRELKGDIKLKKVSFPASLACCTLKAADVYHEAKHYAALVVVKAKTQVWEQIGDIVIQCKEYFKDLCWMPGRSGCNICHSVDHEGWFG